MRRISFTLGRQALLASALALSLTPATSLKADPPAHAEPAKLANGPPAAAPALQAAPAQARDAAARAAAVQRANANERAIAVYCQRLRPFMRAEYYTIIKACELTDAQRTKLADAAERALWSASRWCSAADRIRSTDLPSFPHLHNEIVDPRDRIEADLAAVIRTELSASQQMRYTKVIRERAAFRKATTLNGLIALLEAKLNLDLATRERLREALVKNWDECWIQAVEMYNFSDEPRYFPHLPDEIVSPLLNTEQQRKWNKLQTAAQSRLSCSAFLIYTFTDNTAIEAPELAAAQNNLGSRDQQDPVEAGGLPPVRRGMTGR